ADCGGIPAIVAGFVDTFIDFSVSGGLFLPPEPAIDSSPVPLQTVFSQPRRLIAVGDLHGDLPKTKQALRLAGLIGLDDRWSGGDTTVVQVGDIFDRGGDEIKLLYFFEKLKREAAKTGGLVITLNGNHEIMNVDGDFRYATGDGFREFENWGMWQLIGNSMKKMCDGMDPKFLIDDFFHGLPSELPLIPPQFQTGARARLAALSPNRPISTRFLSKNQTVAVVGDSVFAHGGLLPIHVDYGLDRVNEEVRQWICGLKEKVENQLVRGRNSIVWLRIFSHQLAKDCDCSMLEHVLEKIPGARRMIMGHTIQQDGISGACGNRAIRIDVGMSRVCGDGFPEVLEINERSEIRVLTANPAFLRREYKSPATDAGRLVMPDHRQIEVSVN
ncbi:hypothetical protein M569_00816, partial [Genlisea aurea]